MKRLIIVATALLCLLLPAATASAYNPLKAACGAGGGAGGSSACTSSGKDPISGQGGILTKVSLVIATVAGVAAIIIILVGSFRYITSNGDSSKAAGARNAIVGAAVGLVIIAGAESIVLFVISKL